MKACVLEDVNRLVYKDVSTPQPQTGEVLLKIRACGICSSDIPRIFQTGTYKFPTIPGHEFSGEIVQIGKDVPESLLGKRAVVFPLLPCKKCDSCISKEYARCDNYNYFGSRCDGAFAEYLVVPVWNIVAFSEEIPFDVAALCEPASVAKHCIDAGFIKPNDTVVIVGTGTIGYLAAIWAQMLGASKVIMIGRSDNKLEFARSLGIMEVINSSYEDVKERVYQITSGKGVDVAFECVGSSQAIENAICSVKKGGTVVLTGNPHGNITLDKHIYWKILRSELNIVGTWNSSYNENKNDWKLTLEYMESNPDIFKKLITHKFDLENYEKALHTIQDQSQFSIKVMFEME